MPTFADLLVCRLKAQAFASQASFRAYLADQGASVTDSAVSAWVKGARVPDTAHLVAILDALLVPDADRAAWLAACASHRRSRRVVPSPLPPTASPTTG